MEVSDRLEVKVAEGKDLCGFDGLPPSAFVEIIIGPDMRRTQVVSENKDPKWHAPMMVFTQLVVNDMETIQIYVKHKDVFSGMDTCLGVVFLPMATLYNSPKAEIDDWYNITESTEREPNAGRVTRKLNFDDLGKIRLIITYFNEIDDDLLVVGQAIDGNNAPNLLQVFVSDAHDLIEGKPVEAFVEIKVGSFRRQQKYQRSWSHQRGASPCLSQPTMEVQ